ncbi:hypothetical protein PV05_08672 [Exophiala xenobiotica]|uniref:BTB domain-containing protein n=1 Tax=Exophiala xenobiotica TaxID=348802 RepID=A0A0D2EZC4_9EURO|nr:uncharacterized protein PV05_08672 [Exophiala xenobiotica]KIW53074.1 hypothetical protein PV05_08672 [Exophiala xenobiotica]
MTDSENTSVLEQMVNPGKSDGDVLDIVHDGDMVIKVGNDADARLLRVSSQALKRHSKYFEALLGANWGLSDKKFTVSSPLAVDEDYELGFFVFMLIVHAQIFSDPQVVSKIRLKHLKTLAIHVDKYMYHGGIPTYIIERLDEHIAENHVSAIPKIESLGTIFSISYLLNLDPLFTRASRQMMWWLVAKDLPYFISPEMIQLLPVDIFAEFDKESHRLRSALLKSLPAVFYPEPHSGSTEGDKWWCEKCDAVPHDQRWMQEVISKSAMWNAEQKTPLMTFIGRLFSCYLYDMESMDNSRESMPDGHLRACGHFKPRYIDVNHAEMLQDVFKAMGGVCLHCFRAGRFNRPIASDTR